MGLPENPDEIVLPAEALGGFVDRVPESEALARSLDLHRHRIDTDSIDIQQFRNVLVFHGSGGVGKTELSNRLATWLSHGAGSPDEWGPSPATRVDAIARWDFMRSHGDIDPVPLLLELRRAFGQVRREWHAFDLAFAAYLRVLRPGENFTLTESRGMSEFSVGDVLAAVLSDAAGAADIAGGGGAATATVGVGWSLIAKARAGRRTRRLFEDYRGLAELVEACSAVPGSDEEASRLAARLAYLLSREVSNMAPTQRPMIVVFVDHLERLQVEGRRPGEATLNRLVAALPYCLFVMTGRGALRWDRLNPDLDRSGTAIWPHLSPDTDRALEPRQHRIGNLSIPDAADFLHRAFRAGGIDVTSGLEAELAEQTDGLPLHLTTIVDVARDRAGHGRPLTRADLGGPLPQLVNRIFEDLPIDEAEALRAACLLPYFDAPFAAAAGRTPIGAVERLVRRPIIQRSFDPIYPYRIHDEIRRLVRDTGAEADRGWARQDWLDHADLALSEAKRRYDEALAEQQDRRAILALALALNVGAENGVYAEWLLPAVQNSPTLTGLAPLLSTHRYPDSHPDLVGLIDYVEIMGQTRSVDRATALAALTDRGVSISSNAGLWGVYDLRALGHVDEAVVQLERLIRDSADRVPFYRYQVAMTLALGHRSRDALDQLAQLDDERQQLIRSIVDYRHGLLDRRLASLTRRQSQVAGRRFQIELGGLWLVAKHLRHGVSLAEIDRVTQVSYEAGHFSAQCQARRVSIETHLYEGAFVDRFLADMEDLHRTRSLPLPSSSLPAALAMRYWVCGERRYLDRAEELAAVAPVHVGLGWTQVEVLLRFLGRPMRAEPAQWLEPYDVVFNRWMGHFERVKARALARHKQGARNEK